MRPSGAPRTAATRPASMTLALIHPARSAWRPKSPNATKFPRVARPRTTPRCVFRNFTRFGIMPMSARLLDEGLGQGRLQDAAVDPALHADGAVGGLRRRGAVRDVGLERGERDRALRLLL